MAHSSDETSRELRARALQLEQLLGGIADYAIFFLDSTGIVRTRNRGAERFKGYKPEEIIGRHFRVFYPRRTKRLAFPKWRSAPPGIKASSKSKPGESAGRFEVLRPRCHRCHSRR